jgi:hypothetical protein
MIWYTHSVKDPDSDAVIIDDMEVEIEADVSMTRFSEPSIEIRGVWSKGIDLLRSRSPMTRAIAAQIVEAAENDDAFVESALADAGLIYRSEGYGDPEGHWVRARA